MADRKRPNEQNIHRKPPEDEAVGTQRSNEEQMMDRQSAPKPAATDELQKMQRTRQLNGQGMAPDGAVDGFRVLEQPIGREAVRKATAILQRYKEGKANLEKRIIENEQWYKLRHW